MNNIYENSIVLIGGMSIGKSSVSSLLSEKTNMSVISSDAVKYEVLENVPGYSFGEQLKIRKEKGFTGEMEFLMQYSSAAIKKIIDELDEPSIIDVGAIFDHELDEESISRLKQFKNIIYLYSDNPNEILKRRNVEESSELGQIYLKSLANPVYEELSTKMINVDSKTPEDILGEIVDINKKI